MSENVYDEHFTRMRQRLDEAVGPTVPTDELADKIIVRETEGRQRVLFTDMRINELLKK
jgi:hypothetical protein